VDISPQTIAAIVADIRCTCPPTRRTYAKTHASYCARVVAPEAIVAILEAAARHLPAAASA